MVSNDVTDENYQAHFMIGWSLEEVGQLDDAFPHLAEALRIKPDFADVLNAPAVAYAKAGRFTEAVDTAEHALAVACRNGQKALLNALPSRLTQYRAGQPARERPGDKHQ